MIILFQTLKVDRKFQLKTKGEFIAFSLSGFMTLVIRSDIIIFFSGPGLVFVVYPEGIAQMPISPLWAFLFFFMILTIGLDTQFAMFEAVITGLTDEYPKYLRKYKPAFTGLLCFLCFLLGLPLVTQVRKFQCKAIELCVYGFLVHAEQLELVRSGFCVVMIKM